MSFYNDNEFDKTSAEHIQRNKPRPVNDQRTAYLAQVIDVEERNGFKGYSFLIHMHLVEGPQDLGMKFAFLSQPQNVQANARKGEIGKVKRAVGALYGLDDKASTSITGEIIKRTLGDKERGVTSALRGRIVQIVAVPHTNKKGEKVSFFEMLPYLVNGQPVDRPIDSSVQASEESAPPPAAQAYQAPAPMPVAAQPAPAVGGMLAAAPGAPSAPSAPVDHFARALSSGFQAHQPGWYFRPGDTKCTSEADLRAGRF